MQARNRRIAKGQSKARSAETQDKHRIAPKKRKQARLNPACIVCGSTNPKGLCIRFQLRSNAMCADWIPTGDWESFQGTIHGGIVTTVLDEAMSQAIIAREWEALTVELRVRFRGRVSPGDRLHVRGWIIEKKGRRILTEATLKTDGDLERAHAWATFLIPPRRSVQVSGTVMPVKIRRAAERSRKATSRMIEVKR